MKFDKISHVSFERKLKDQQSYRSIFENALEKIEMKDGVFSIHIQFSDTKYTEKNMSLEIQVDFSSLIDSSKIFDADVLKSYSYKNKIVKIHMNNQQYEQLTQNNPNYLLSIYDSIISEAIDLFSEL
ncbi:MAG: hypothetical protein J6J60_03135 [Clostridia bacterium]|nr:hypothetical protein [Clostridia bacterium]